MRFLPGLLLLAVSCAPDPAASVDAADALVDTGTDPACDEPDLPTWENWGEGFFVTWCQSCHSRTTPQRAGAPEGVDFDSASDVQQAEAAIRRTVLESRSMPVGGGLPEADLHDLDRLLRCGP